MYELKELRPKTQNILYSIWSSFTLNLEYILAYTETILLILFQYYTLFSLYWRAWLREVFSLRFSTNRDKRTFSPNIGSFVGLIRHQCLIFFIHVKKIAK